jgi:hypothetical protein
MKWSRGISDIKKYMYIVILVDYRFDSTSIKKMVIPL